MAIITDEAFIIKNRRFKESDKIMTFFGYNRGKFAAIAKGAARPEVRKTGSLETGSIVKLSLAEGKTLDIVTEVAAITTNENSRESNKILLYAAELVDKYTIEHDEDKVLFQKLKKLVQNIHKDDSFKSVNSLHLLLIEKAGLLPDFTECALTKTPIKPGEKVFLSEAGPVISSYQNPLPTWPTIKSDYFIVLANHEEYQTKTNAKIEKNIFKILNFITEKSLEKTIISKNLFKID